MDGEGSWEDGGCSRKWWGPGNSLSGRVGGKEEPSVGKPVGSKDGSVGWLGDRESRTGSRWKLQMGE